MSEFNLEAKEHFVYEVKQTLLIDGKESSRSLGFSESQEKAEEILQHLSHGGKIVEKQAFLIRKKSDHDDSRLIVNGKVIHLIYYIDNAQEMPLEQYQSMSREQKRYIDLTHEK